MVVIGNGFYPVEKILTSTTFTLSETNNPGQNFTGSATVVKDAYQLPGSIRTINEVWCTTRSRRLSYYPESEVTGFSRFVARKGVPVQYAFRASDRVYGAIDFVIMPAPETVESFEVNAVVAPKPLAIYEVVGSNGSGAGSRVFTSGTSVFTDNMVGAVLRISPNSAIPKEGHSSMRAESTFSISSLSPGSIRNSS